MHICPARAQNVESQDYRSWGRPKRISATILASGSHEQWVYGDTGSYVYFEDGIVAAIQN